MNIQLQKLNKLYETSLKDKKLLFIALLAGIGLLLIFFSLLTGEKTDKKSDDSPPKSEYVFNEAEYTEALERKLGEFVSSINGAGECRVILTLECDCEKVYARDKNFSVSDDKSDVDSEYIILDTEDSENGLVLLTIQPKVRGVAVTCEGGDSDYIRSEVTLALEALLNLGANRISVSKLSK